MTSFPEIFSHTKSDLLRPNKISGIYSIHLRSTTFHHKANPSLSKQKIHHATNISQNERYSKSLLSRSKEDSFRSSKGKMSKSYSKKYANNEQCIMIEEKGFETANINQLMNQSKNEEASSFKSIRKYVLESTVLLEKSLDVIKHETTCISTEMATLKANIQGKLQQIKRLTTGQMQFLYKQYRVHKRQSNEDMKIIYRQSELMREEVQTIRDLTQEIDSKSQLIEALFK